MNGGEEVQERRREGRREEAIKEEVEWFTRTKDREPESREERSGEERRGGAVRLTEGGRGERES